MGKIDAFFCQTIQTRRLDIRVTGVPGRLGAPLIAEDEDDIGSFQRIPLLIFGIFWSHGNQINRTQYRVEQRVGSRKRRSRDQFPRPAFGKGESGGCGRGDRDNIQNITPYFYFYSTLSFIFLAMSMALSVISITWIPSGGVKMNRLSGRDGLISMSVRISVITSLSSLS